MYKILFLGSKPIGYKCLSILINLQAENMISVEGVLTNDNLRFGEDYSVRKLSSESNLRIINELDEILELNDIDYIISVQYHKILKRQHIAIAQKLAINLHMAPLPELRGCNQFSFAIFNNLKEFGTTLHQLGEGIDSGDIIFESRFPIPDKCNVKELYDLTYEKSISLFENKILDILNGNYTLVPQNDLIKIRSVSINFRKDINRIKIIDLNMSAAQISKQVRATAMPGFEPPYAIIDGKKIYLIPEEIFNKYDNSIR
jgi:methionyl-tRNA formyltransferase